MHSQSRKWIAPKVKQQEKLRRFNFAREKVCKKSFAWPLDYDLDEHKKAYAQDLRKLNVRKEARLIKEKSERELQSLPAIPHPVEAKPAMNGKKFNNNRSTVMSQETVFALEFETYRKDDFHSEEKDTPKEVADWPCRDEAKYEGDDRISTDRLHGRFPGLPRVSANNTVNWMQRTIIPQYPLDNFYVKPTEHEVFWRHNIVDEIEIDNEEGRKLIGNELMELLNE